MQVENISRNTPQSLETQATSKCTADDVVNVAEKVSHCWKRLVLKLSAEYFMNKIKVLEMENKDDCIMQAVTALNMWINELGDEANQAAMIRAMCSIGCTSQAEDVFSRSLVAHICSLK